ncbi:hypothetical protein TWF106_006923 [Orbilia oligospora]|uniref:Metallo-beta-lactamase domain-containing protein n=1 Tax=Orbilia oligospora TaxID=2813651 RepID=A0A7C8UL59_ORBOL|nr:hypothetical protein TWF106_006923 [Orbilia oligospora]
MPITLRHITADSTWLITLTSPHNPPSHAPFNILVDPWIVGPSEVWHPKFAQNHHTTPSSIQSLEELDPQPDILLISQTKSDHCNEATCRQLSKDGSLQVYTVPGADSIVKSWKHFNPENVHRLRPFTSRRSGRVSRIPIYKNPVPSKPATGESITSTSSETDKDKKDKDEDEYSFETDPSIAAIVELAFLPALKPWEIPSIHIGLGITYTPTQEKTLPPSPPLTPPSTNLLHPTVSAAHRVPSTITLSTVPSNLSTSPSNKSNPINTTTHLDSPNRFPKKPNSPSKPSSKKSINLKQPGPKNSLTDSLLYTPHGVPPSALTQYLYSLPLPLTAFLHCFVKVDNPKWLGGTVSSGLPNALKILTEVKKIRAEQARLVEEPISPKSNCSTEYPLGVKYLVATHDEEVKLEGFCSHFVKKIKWDVKEVDDELKKVAGDEALEGRRSKELSSSDAEDKIESYEDVGNVKAWDGPAGIKLLDLEVGEKAVLV